MGDDLTGSVRTRFDIKKDLLRRAIKGDSRYTPAEMILLILWIQSRAREAPDEHEKELDMIREIEREQEELRAMLRDMGISEDDLAPESRALLRLNAEERRRGLDGLWGQDGHLRTLLSAPSPSDSLN